MPVKVSCDGGICALEVDGELTIFNAAELKGVLLDALASIKECSDIRLDLSRIGEMDSSGFQLLLLLKREAGRMNSVLRIAAHSDATRAVMELYRMMDYFER